MKTVEKFEFIDTYSLEYYVMRIFTKISYASRYLTLLKNDRIEYCLLKAYIPGNH